MFASASKGRGQDEAHLIFDFLEHCGRVQRLGFGPWVHDSAGVDVDAVWEGISAWNSERIEWPGRTRPCQFLCSKIATGRPRGGTHGSLDT